MVMPKVGEIQRRIYKYPTYTSNIYVVWSACEKCGRERWTRYFKRKPKNTWCHVCANKFKLKREVHQGDTECPVLDAKQVNATNLGIANYTRNMEVTDWAVVNLCLNCAYPECILVVKDEARSKRSLSAM